MTDKSRTLSLRQYGALRGVSGEAIRKAIKTGRLQKSVSYDEKGWPRIDPAIAETEWPPGKAPTRSKLEPDVADEILATAGVQVPVFDPDQEIPEPTLEIGERSASALARNRAVREAYEARLKKLDWEQKSGLLVEADAVKSEAFKMARSVRDAMLNIPDRLAAEIAAETDQFKVHQRLEEEIRKALEGLGDE